MKFIIKLIFTILIVGLSTIFLSDLLEKHTKFGQKNIENRKRLGDDTTSLWDKLWTDTNKCSSEWVLNEIKKAFFEWSKSSDEVYAINFEFVSMDSQDQITGTKICTANITAKFSDNFISKYKETLNSSTLDKEFEDSLNKKNEIIFEYKIKKDELTSNYIIEYSEKPFKKLISDKELIRRNSYN